MSFRFVLAVLALSSVIAGPSRAVERARSGVHFEVSGTVYVESDHVDGKGAGEQVLAGVAVSNGRQVVRTDEAGRYRIKAASGDMVFVIKPGGYRLPEGPGRLPLFWRRIEAGGSHASAGLDFGLLASVEGPDSGLDVLLFADSQVKSARDIEYYRKDIVEPLHGTRAAFGLTLGDLVDDRVDLYPQLNAVTATLGIPWFHVPGNHDIDANAGDDASSLQAWQAVYGPDTYAIEEGAASFVFLDDVVLLPGGGGRYVGGLREEQFEFLQAYLDGLPADRLLVLALHIPLFDTGGRQTFRGADRERLFSLLRGRERLLVLSGHSHNQQHYRHGPDDGWSGREPLHEYNVGAACGAFWSGVAGSSGVPDTTMSDGTPNGSGRLTVFEGGRYDLAWSPAPGDGSAPGINDAMALHAPKVLRRGAYPAWGVYANVFMGEADTRVEYRVDGGQWMPMRRVERPDPRLVALNVADDLADSLRAFDRSPEAVDSTHLWRGALPTDLHAGSHRVEVRAFDRWRGEVGAAIVYRLEDAQEKTTAVRKAH